MKKYSVISFDMFQTLVDVNQRIPDIWRGILGESYTIDKGLAGARAVMAHLTEEYEKSLNPFRSMEEMYLECARHAVRETGFSVTPESIAYHLMYQHGYAPFYDETLSVLEKVRQEYEVVLSSDSNHLMVDPILEHCHMQEVFISDDMKCYKGEPTGRFFQIVLAELDIEAGQILHVGDSLADIEGAKVAGVDCCWLNRDAREWKHSVQPDYIIRDLNELLSIAEITI